MKKKLLGGEKITNWIEIRRKFSVKSFIPSIVDFKNSNITDEIRTVIKEQYFTKSDFVYDKVKQASSACGPLYKWIYAHVNYSDIKKCVKPLKVKIAEYVGKMVDGRR